MKRIFGMNLIKPAAVLVLATLLNVAASAEPAAAVNDNIYNYLQLLRSDVNSAKVELINTIMKLSAEDAKKFWPIYRDYENELGKLAVNRAELVTEFVQAHKTAPSIMPRPKIWPTGGSRASGTGWICWRSTTAKSRRHSRRSKPGSFSKSRTRSGSSLT